jgi:transcriptional regulator with XRE-family HTH domain
MDARSFQASLLGLRAILFGRPRLAACGAFEQLFGREYQDRRQSREYLAQQVFCKRVLRSHNLVRQMHAMEHVKEINVMAKKAPTPIDRHVGNRVRMRRLMLEMSQEKLADALGLTFQQVQKYEKGTNRIGASRLQHISDTLQVPVAFFFEGAPHVPGPAGSVEMDAAPSPAYVADFLATSDGLSLTKAFMRIPDAKLRRRIVNLVEQIAGEEIDA